MWLGTSPPVPVSHGHLKPLHDENMIFLKALCMKLDCFIIWEIIRISKSLTSKSVFFCTQFLSLSHHFFFTLSVFWWLQHSFYCFPSSPHSFSSQPVDHIYHFFSFFSFLPVFVHSFRESLALLWSLLFLFPLLYLQYLSSSLALSLFSPLSCCVILIISPLIPLSAVRTLSLSLSN